MFASWCNDDQLTILIDKIYTQIKSAIGRPRSVDEINFVQSKLVLDSPGPIRSKRCEQKARWTGPRAGRAGSCSLAVHIRRFVGGKRRRRAID